MKGDADAVKERTTVVRLMEPIFFVSGIALLAVYGATIITGNTASHAAVVDFKAAQATLQPFSTIPEQRAPEHNDLDITDWSRGRAHSYRASLTAIEKPAIAVLRIPRLHIEVPVFEGTGSVTLNRGVGHIVGTAALGGSGNSGIAGHRDRFFRDLKDIVVGDRIELSSTSGLLHYEVRQTSIVLPSEVSVLADRVTPTLTLVTCFPFYFVGIAPQRFIVRAIPVQTPGPAGSSELGTNQLTERDMEQK